MITACFGRQQYRSDDSNLLSKAAVPAVLEEWLQCSTASCKYPHIAIATASTAAVDGCMQCAIAIWQCLRDVRENHKAWRHLASPLTEADLPRQISEATKLSAALKSGMAAAPAGDKEAPAVIATITERPAIAGDKVGGKPAAAAVVDASEGLQQQVTPVVSLQCDSDVSSTAATVSSSAGSDSDDYDSSNGGNALKSVSSVDSDAAARPHPNFSEVSSSAVVGGGSSGSPADQAAAGEQVHTGSELAPHVAQFNDDPDEYEFHL